MTPTIITTELTPAEYKSLVIWRCVKYAAWFLLIVVAGPLTLGIIVIKPALILPAGGVVILSAVVMLGIRFVSHAPTRTIEHIHYGSIGYATRAPEKADPDAV